MPQAQIGPIAVHYPKRRETNEQLQAEFPDWDMDLIGQKTGIESRFIAEPNETSADLAVAACEKLFAEHGVDRQCIDFILLCTQTPDYPLPTTACLIQHRLGLKQSCGALDFNLGCSGFVYGLALADGLLRSRAARNILLITAETYSKYIDPDDRSLRTIFGDAAAATLIFAVDGQEGVGAFQFGTDGAGADTLLVSDGGTRPSEHAIKPRHRKRWKSRLYMDGPSLLSFTVEAVPQLIGQVLELADVSSDEVDIYLLHQATRKMLEQLQSRLQVDESKLPIRLTNCGNTVSCTLPILISDLRQEGVLKPGSRTLLIGFGVGWSWAGCTWQVGPKFG
ncbi:MAG: ketoacyl-ACP synthase III [Planctomycetales bacterium]|nr:ketoacyl-ACP synthase III [Planctomycetales bacterium]